MQMGSLLPIVIIGALHASPLNLATGPYKSLIF